MELLAKSDIFFVIASVGTVLGIVILAVLGVYSIKIARDVQRISSRAREEVEAAADDLAAFRKDWLREGMPIRRVLGLLFSLRKPSSRRARRHSVEEDAE
jgi:hypothetical protein